MIEPAIWCTRVMVHQPENVPNVLLLQFECSSPPVPHQISETYTRSVALHREKAIELIAMLQRMIQS